MLLTWGFRPRKRKRKTVPTPGPEPTEEVWSRPGHSPGFGVLVFSRDGKHIYTTGASFNPPLKVGAIGVWDAATGKPVGALHGHKRQVSSLALSPDGTRLLSGGSQGDHTVRLWDLARGEEIACFQGHNSHILGVAFAPDGKRAVSIGGHEDYRVRLWDLAQPPDKAGRDLGGLNFMSAVEFLDERQVAATTSLGRQFTVWNLEGKIVSERRLPQSVNALALTRDGRYLATANNNGTAYILRLPLHRR